MRFLFPGMKAFRLFCLCLSKVILVGLLYGICGLEGGTNMLLYNFRKHFSTLILETHQQYIKTAFTVLLTMKQVSKAMEAGMLK